MNKQFVKNDSTKRFMLVFYDTIVHNHLMDRRVNKELLNNWIQEHGPDGISRLAVESRVSAETIKRSRASGIAPKKLSTCLLISKAVGANLDELFPLENKAS